MNMMFKVKNTVNSPIKAPLPIKVPPLCFLRSTLTQNFTFKAISQPEMVRFSFCKKPLEAKNALYLLDFLACALIREFEVALFYEPEGYNDPQFKNKIKPQFLDIT